MKYKRISVIDNYQEKLWWKAEQIGDNYEKLVDLLLQNRSVMAEDVVNELPICDEIVYDDDGYVITYTDGMCERLSLYEITK